MPVLFSYSAWTNIPCKLSQNHICRSPGSSYSQAICWPDIGFIIKTACLVLEDSFHPHSHFCLKMTQNATCYLCFFESELIQRGKGQLWASYQMRKIAGCACAGNAGNVFPTPPVSDPNMHHGTCMTHVPWCMLGSLTSSFLWSWWRGKRSRHSRCMRNPQFYVSGKRPMGGTCQVYQVSTTQPIQGHERCFTTFDMLPKRVFVLSHFHDCKPHSPSYGLVRIRNYRTTLHRICGAIS